MPSVRDMLAAAGGGLGLPSLFGLRLTMEAGVPIPLPGDLLMLVAGERVAAGALTALPGRGRGGARRPRGG